MSKIGKSSIIILRIHIRLVSQAVGVILLRKKKEAMPYKMILFPLPAIIAIVVWLFIFYSSGLPYILGALGVIASGMVVYYFFSRQK